LRFITSESWRTLPGLFFNSIRRRYPQQKDLPLAQLPDEILRHQTNFTYQPLVQFLSDEFLIQFGPRVVSLVTKRNHYPGWQAVERELQWLLNQLQQLAFISEGERLGTRYINFFEFGIFEELLLDITTSGRSLAGGELSVTTVLQRPPFTARLQVANSAILGTGNGARTGSVLDIDVWLGSLDFDIFQNDLTKFSEAHELEKQIFFGLLKTDFLKTLNPKYK